MLQRIIKAILIGNVDFEKQQLSKDTLNILAVINYKFWTKEVEHKKWLLSQYKKNEESHKNIEVKELFKDTADKKYENKTIENKELVLIMKKNIFSRIINFIKNIGKT